MEKVPLVSIACITYNHVKFISQALDGFIMQKTSFPFEIIIHDDCSTDGTKDIIKSYTEKYPDIIKPIYQNINQYSLGKRIIPIIVPACKGKYVALCEGDDYWTDPLKLQKQVDFLEASPDYSICFHRVYNQINTDLSIASLNKSDHEETYTIEDLAKGNFIHTPSVVFKNNLIKKFPLWFDGVAAGDYVLHMLNAQYGNIKYLPEPMAVYRLHSGSLWSSKTIGDLNPKWIKLLDDLISKQFSTEVKELLLFQKKEKVNEYIIWLLEQNEHDLLKKIVNKYYNNSSMFNIEELIDAFLNYIIINEEYIRQLETSKSFRTAKILSKLKNRIIPFLKI